MLPLQNRSPDYLAPKKGFTLIEILVVLAIIAVLATVSGPAIQMLDGAGSVNKASSDVSSVLDLARAYAMTNHTYVRVAFSQIPGASNSPTLVIMPIYSADGTLLQDSSGDMANASLWPAVIPPLAIQNFMINDGLNASSPDTTADVTPSGMNASGTPIPSFSRPVPGSSTVPIFDMFVEFNPTGEACVIDGTPTHYIKIGIQKMTQLRNPVILRLSGLNGYVTVLRKENM
jgi:prepilin-type N-terminal cleavage/methylation domain-containing protein